MGRPSKNFSCLQDDGAALRIRIGGQAVVAFSASNAVNCPPAEGREPESGHSCAPATCRGRLVDPADFGNYRFLSSWLRDFRLPRIDGNSANKNFSY